MYGFNDLKKKATYETGNYEQIHNKIPHSHPSLYTPPVSFTGVTE